MKYINIVLISAALCLCIFPLQKAFAKEKIKPQDIKPLNLELIATFVMADDKSLAVIKDNITGYKATYKAGDRVKDAILSRILLSKVIFIRKDGREESLKITSRRVNAFIKTSDIVITTANKNTVHKKLLIAKYKNLNNILKETIILPEFSKGKIEGIKVWRLKKDGIIEKAGLKESDVVEEINNYKLSGLQEAVNIYKNVTNQLKTSPTLKLQVKVKRQNEIKTINYEIVD